jgi:hypothetical protein
MFASSLLTLHLLALPGAFDPGLVHPLRLLPGAETGRPASTVLVGSLGVPTLRFLTLGQADLNSVPPPEPPSSTVAGSPPPLDEDKRKTIMATETGVGAGALLIHDCVLALVDLFLVLVVSTGSLGGNGTLAVGALLGLAGLELIDLAGAPFLMAAVVYGISHRFDDTGGNFWRAAGGAFLGEGATVALGFLLILLGSGLDASNGSGSSFTFAAILLSEALRLVGMPLAASIGLHWGQAVVPELSPYSTTGTQQPSNPNPNPNPGTEPPPLPTMPDVNPAGPTSGPPPPPSFTFNALSVHFG